MTQYCKSEFLLEILNSVKFDSVAMRSTCLIFATMAIPFLATLYAEEALPPDVQRVVNQRAAAIAKIDQVFLQELEKLKNGYTKRGDLDNANRINGMIAAMYPKGVSAPFEKDLIGRWKIYDPASPASWSGSIKINNDMSYEWKGGNGYSDVLITNLSKGKCKIVKNELSIGPYSFNVSTLDSGKIIAKYENVIRVMEKISE